jgi:chromosome segregation ATPase
MRHSIKDILCVEHSTSPNDDILERITVTSASDTASIADKHINADDRMSNLEQQLNKFYTEVDRCVRTLTDRIGALEQKDIDQPTVAEPEHIVLQPAGEAKDHIKALESQHSAILDNVRALELERDILRENISDILRTIAALKDDISSLERRYRTPGIIQRYVILSAHRITSISLRIITSPVTVPMCAIVSFLYVIKRVIR